MAPVDASIVPLFSERSSLAVRRPVRTEGDVELPCRRILREVIGTPDLRGVQRDRRSGRDRGGAEVDRPERRRCRPAHRRIRHHDGARDLRDVVPRKDDPLLVRASEVATAPVDGFTDTSVWSMCANSAFGLPASAPASAPAPVPPESFALPEPFPPPPSLPGLGVEVSGTPASGVGVDVDSVSSPHPASAVVTRPTESRRQPRRWQNASPSCPDPARARGHPPKRVRAVARPRASARSAGIPISTTAANRGGTCAAKVR